MNSRRNVWLLAFCLGYAFLVGLSFPTELFADPPKVTESRGPTPTTMISTRDSRASNDIAVLEVGKIDGNVVTLTSSVAIQLMTNVAIKAEKPTAATIKIDVDITSSKFRFVNPKGDIIPTADLLKRLKPGLLVVREFQDRADQPAPKNRSLLKDDAIIWQVTAPVVEKK